MPFYSLLLLVVLVGGAPFWLLRMATSGRYRSGLLQRLGLVPHELRARVGSRPVIWLHAVSVGEVAAAGELLAALERAYPDYAIALSTTTDTGQSLAQQRYPQFAVFYLPLDFALLVRRYLRVLRPRVLLLMESELWPNLIRESRRSGADVAVVNARISDRSFPRYLRLRWLWRPVLRPVALFLAQGEETAARLRAIGIPSDRVRVCGNLKYDLRDAPQGEIFHAIEAALPTGSPVLVAGSTLEGEERILLQAWTDLLRTLPEAILVLAPRHRPRFDSVAALAADAGLHVYRASRLPPDTQLTGGDAVVLDTIGDLAGVYALATAAFLGGSLVRAGGHNPLEAARFAVPVIMGSSFENFREVVTVMQASDAIRVLGPGPTSGAQLSKVLHDLLSGDSAVRALGERGRSCFQSQAGATACCLEALRPLLRSSTEPGA